MRIFSYLAKFVAPEITSVYKFSAKKEDYVCEKLRFEKLAVTLASRLDVVVENGALRGEFDRLELRRPPFWKLNPMVTQLVLEKGATKRPHTRPYEI